MSAPARLRRIRASLVVALAVGVAIVLGGGTAGDGSTESAPVEEPGPTVVTEPDRPPPGVERLVPESSAPPPSGTVPPADDCCAEGSPRLVAYTNPDFDAFTRNLDADRVDVMRRDYPGGLVTFAPYWNQHLPAFDDVWVYLDLYAIYVDRVGDLEHLILRDAAGTRMYIPWGCTGSGCPQYAGDLGSDEFRAVIDARVGALVDAGYRRILLDDVNLAMRVSDASGTERAPVDPRTGAAMTSADWRRAVAETVEGLAARWPEVEFAHNSIWFVDSPDWSDPFVDRQIAAADLVVLERGGSDAGLTGGSGRFSLAALLSFVDRVHALGTSVMFWHQGPDTPAGHERNLATHLLVTDGRDLVATNDVTHATPGAVWPGYGLELGAALGPRTVADGIHRRDFADGLVVLAEPGAPARTVALPRPMVGLDGTLVTDVTVGDGEARILQST